jgi:Skp family chaperone for outer membrane proteins
MKPETIERRPIMFSRMLLVVVLSAMVCAPARAQDAPRIAICYPDRVFDHLAERRAIEDGIAAMCKSLQAEAKEKQIAIDQARWIVGGYDAGEPSRSTIEAGKRLWELMITFDSWARLSEQNVRTIETMKTNALFDKISQAVAEVAARDNVDIVIAAQEPPIDLAKLTPDQLRASLMARTVLYSNPNSDITQEVVAKMNAEYHP